MINPQSFVIYNLALGNILIFILTKLEHFPVHFSLPSLMPVTHRLLSLDWSFSPKNYLLSEPPTQPDWDTHEMLSIILHLQEAL